MINRIAPLTNSRRIEFQILAFDDDGEPCWWRAWACCRPDMVWEAADLGEVIGAAVLGAEEELGLEIEMPSDPARN